MKKFRILATTAFGIEGITKREVKKLGFENIKVENGKVYFDGTKKDIIKANLWLRTASKIYIILDEFKAYEFDTLYERIYELPWQDLIGKEDKFPVLGNSVKSKLHNVPSIQSIGKKAVVDKLKTKYNCDWFDETDNNYEILVDIYKDKVSVRLNTTGEGLHKRGYRLEKNEAPLRETLSASLLQIARWKAKIPLIDPLCGTGTILIEAAMYAKNIAPGLNREFDFEKWDLISDKLIKEQKNDAKNKEVDREVYLKGYDKDNEVIEIAKSNAKRANVLECIDFKCQELKDLEVDKKYGYLITNPPYGERLGSYEEAKHINELLGKKGSELETWSKYIFTSFDSFEEVYGKKATKNRKLYNGKIRCYFYQYYGPRPPKNRL